MFPVVCGRAPAMRSCCKARRKETRPKPPTMAGEHQSLQGPQPTPPQAHSSWTQRAGATAHAPASPLLQDAEGPQPTPPRRQPTPPGRRENGVLLVPPSLTPPPSSSSLSITSFPTTWLPNPKSHLCFHCQCLYVPSFLTWILQ